MKIREAVALFAGLLLLPVGLSAAPRTIPPRPVQSIMSAALYRTLFLDVSSSIKGTAGATTGGNNGNWTGTNNFIDTGFTVYDNGDTTKKLSFEASGITTANTISIGVGGTSVSAQFRMTNGTATLPSYAFTNETNTGWYIVNPGSPGSIFGAIQGNARFFVSNTQIATGSSSSFCWTSTAGVDASTCDAVLSRDTTATIQMGIDAAAPVAQTLKGADARAGTDSNTAGGNVTLAPGRSTGTGTGGDLIGQRDPTVQSSGSTANALVEAWRVVSKARTLTDATATTLIQVTGLGAHTHAGGTIKWAARASDGTNDQSASGLLSWACWDTTAGAGGEGSNVQIVGTNAAGGSSGTLTCTAASTTGTDLCNIQINCDSTVITPTTLEAYYQYAVNCRGCTVTPQ